MQKTLYVAIATTLIVLKLSTGVEADDFQILPSILVRQEYNDNIFFTSSDKVDDNITTVIGALEISNRTELLDLNLRGTVAPFFYWDNGDLDDVDQDYRGRAGYRFTERFSAGANAAYRVDNSPNRDVVTTGLVLNNDRRKTWHFGANAGYSLSEITEASLSYSYEDTDWSDPDADRQGSSGYDLNLGMTRNLSLWLRPTTGRLNFGYSDWDYDTSKTSSFFGSVGVDSALTEKFHFLVDIGARYVDSDFKTVELVGVPPGILVPKVVNRSNSGWGGIGSAGLQYSGLRTNAGLIFSHDLRTGSGTSPSVLTRLVGNADYRLLEKLSVGLTAGAYRNKADRDDFSFQEIDTMTYNLRPRVRWEFYDNFTLEGAYTYTFVDDNAADDTRSQHRAYLQVAYGLPLFEIFDFIRATETPAGGFPWPLPR